MSEDFSELDGYKKANDDLDLKVTLLENKITLVKALIKERLMDADYKETVFLNYLLTSINQ